MFLDVWETSQRSDIRAYIRRGFAGAEPLAWRDYNNRRKDIADAVTITSYANQLVRPSGTIDEITSYETFLAYLEVPTEFRTGYLNSIYVSYEIDDGPTGLPNPRFASKYASNYVRQSLFLSAVPSADNRLLEVCEVASSLISAQRQLIPLAHAVRERTSIQVGEASSALSSSFGLGFNAYLGQMHKNYILALATFGANWPDAKSNLSAANNTLVDSTWMGPASAVLSRHFSEISDSEINAALVKEPDPAYTRLHYRIRQLAFIYDTLHSSFGQPMQVDELEQLIKDRVDDVPIEDMLTIYGSSGLSSLGTHTRSETLPGGNGSRVTVRVAPSRDIHLWPERYFVDPAAAFVNVSVEVGESLTSDSVKAEWENKVGEIFLTYDTPSGEPNTRTNFSYFSGPALERILTVSRAFLKEALIQEFREMNNSRAFRDLLLKSRNVERDLVELMRGVASIDTLSELSSFHCRSQYDTAAEFVSNSPINYIFVKDALDALEVPENVSDPIRFVSELSSSLAEVAEGLYIANEDVRTEAEACDAIPQLSETLIQNLLYVQEHRPDLMGSTACYVP